MKKVAFENITRNAAARIAATTLPVFRVTSLRENRGRFVIFTVDEIMIVVDVHWIKPDQCRVSVELGRGKSLTCITGESMTSPIAITF